MKKYVNIFKETLKSYSRDHVSKEAAALSFYTILSLPALLIVVVSIVGLFVDKTEAINLLLSYTTTALGQTEIDSIAAIISKLPNLGTFTLSTYIGFLFLIFAATKVLGSMQSALNNIWNVI